MRKYILSVGAMLLAFMLGPPGRLSAGTVSMQLTGVSQSLGSYYVAPYQVSVGGTNQNLICDDALDNVNMGQKWNATTETFSNLNGALFLNGKGQQQVTAYEEAGWLVQQIFNNLGNAKVAGEYQYALWDLFDPGFSNTSGTLSNGEPGADLSAAEQSVVNADLLAAENASNYASSSALAYDANLVIYTPTPQGPGEPQEFFGVDPPAAPEPMTLWSLLLTLAAIALACKWTGKTTVKSSNLAGM